MGDLAIILCLTGVALATAAISVFISERLRLDRVARALSQGLAGRRRVAVGGLSGFLVLLALVLMVTPGAGVGTITGALFAGIALLAVAAAAPSTPKAKVIVSARDVSETDARSKAA